MSRTLICLAVVAATHATGVAGQVANAADSLRIARLDREFARGRERLRLPGLAVAVVRAGSVIWSKGYGFADVERRVAVTATTPFNIASLTKPMASALLMQLVERGELSLDEPIARYAPGVGKPNATIRHVLSMTAESDPPGTGYAYNGNVYASLDKVLQARTGQTFRQLLVSRIFEPLQMVRSVPGHDALDSIPRARDGLGEAALKQYAALLSDLASPYRIFGRTEIVPALPPPPELSTAANVISTVLDYARFVSGLTSSRLIADSTLARVWSPNVPSSGKRLPYSLGWFVQDYERQRLVWQHGYWPDAYSALILVVPESRLALVALANADGLSSPFYWSEGVEGNVLACGFLREFVSDRLPCAQVASAAVSRWEDRRKASPLRVANVDRSPFDRYAGMYRTPSGRRVRIARQGDRLWWQPSRGGSFELFPLGNARFFLKAADYQLTFVSEPGGAVSRIDLATGGRTLAVVRDDTVR